MYYSLLELFNYDKVALLGFLIISLIISAVIEYIIKPFVEKIRTGEL